MRYGIRSCTCVIVCFLFQKIIFDLQRANLFMTTTHTHMYIYIYLIYYTIHFYSEVLFILYTLVSQMCCFNIALTQYLRVLHLFLSTQLCTTNSSNIILRTRRSPFSTFYRKKKQIQTISNLALRRNVYICHFNYISIFALHLIVDQFFFFIIILPYCDHAHQSEKLYRSQRFSFLFLRVYMYSSIIHIIII